MYKLILLFIITISCGTSQIQEESSIKHSKGDLIIAFGSCSNQSKAQPLWDDIVKENPHTWIWLGDNIYGDTEDMDVLRAKYNQQKSHPEYQKLMKSTFITGTWDDHDYGQNDAGKYYPKRTESQLEFLKFMEATEDDPRYKREGVYRSYNINHPIGKVKILLLDTRYFRDDPIKEGDTYIPNEYGTVLGENQWNWLERELENSDADIHIFASGIQLIPEQHRFEKWSNFPSDRDRFIELIQKSKTKRPIVISGDRHIGEISKLSQEGMTLYDITSSSLTHGWSVRREEANKHRMGDIVYDLNYGILQITKDMSIKTYLKGDNQAVLEMAQIEF